MARWQPNLGERRLHAQSAAPWHYLNYDYVTKAAVYDPSSPVHALPNSLYMTKAPDFMAGYDWPWVDPVTGQTTTLPAKARFDAMPRLP